MIKKVTCRVIHSSPLRGRDFKCVVQSQHDSEHPEIRPTEGINLHKNTEINPAVYSTFSGRGIPVKIVPVFGQFVDYYA